MFFCVLYYGFVSRRLKIVCVIYTTYNLARNNSGAETSSAASTVEGPNAVCGRLMTVVQADVHRVDIVSNRSIHRLQCLFDFYLPLAL